MSLVLEAARRPHPGTGEPRPPRAPVRSDRGGEGKRAEWKAKYPTAPSPQRPVLEWYQGQVSDSVLAGIFVSLLVIAFGMLKDWGFGWMSTWWLWIFVVWPPFFFYFRGQQYGISAGADWFATKHEYVDTYKLSKVKLVGASGGLAWDLTLRDESGRELTTELRQLQSNRDLWDLVYNGIVHSVVRGAKTNPKAIDKLRLR